jgi:phage-related protein
MRRGFGDARVVELLAPRSAGTERAVHTFRFAQAIPGLHHFQSEARPGIPAPEQDLDLTAQLRARYSSSGTSM